ncbi:hypothetical protein M422DRAFT_273165 [Sphaerobolus stellatus SS14]|uniref:Uncharacterized protein n=1 Tax=Sphaerobolus stellatus (strain SS14) TaxID=990650 RepID=A0A0C9T9U5_SPHS4|nr:hypothetical protein M422DRAFT_273165 [Sphaerobolus stellatus SS14]
MHFHRTTFSVLISFIFAFAFFAQLVEGAALWVPRTPGQIVTENRRQTVEDRACGRACLYATPQTTDSNTASDVDVNDTPSLSESPSPSAASPVVEVPSDSSATTDSSESDSPSAESLSTESFATNAASHIHAKIALPVVVATTFVLWFL